jgi:8-oxo-dGTP pyrophosphatase MutT (NUDIX family)
MAESSFSARPRRALLRPGFDPAAQAWVPVNDTSAAIPLCLLTPERVRRSLGRPEVWSQDFSREIDVPYPGRQDSLVPAAVLIALVSRPQEISILLTQRAAHLYDHAGQISFPGGCIEAQDRSPVAAALREAQEEIGLPANDVEVLGSMPSYLTATGFSIVPVVSLVQPNFTMTPDAFEVAAVFEVPLAFITDPANHRLYQLELPDGQQRQYYAMSWGEYFIWGATAGMLRNLYHLLRIAVSNA